MMGTWTFWVGAVVRCRCCRGGATRWVSINQVKRRFWIRFQDAYVLEMAFMMCEDCFAKVATKAARKEDVQPLFPRNRSVVWHPGRPSWMTFYQNEIVNDGVDATIGG